MSLLKIAMVLVCTSMTLIGAGSIAHAEYTAPTTASKGGDGTGISFSGNIAWEVGHPIINDVDIDIIDANKDSAQGLGSLSFTYDSAARTVKIQSQFVAITGGPFRVRLNWYHNEGGDLKEQSTSFEVTVPAPPGEGEGD
ncbi:hypothetical protein [Singulisphaera acidiphila]|uniref:Secreted protein n=1 Tax=Singulisphaera acidiphila (strain ATCC BAA-1392 / DSM 18658 / VKM B-2454 / MOB10) TaxID=886293 RepID=L0DFS0_SINAD|nr:hypothetical protein [Singulisphaera acidiphila]AGA28219.1 hypothetical protein Sinac_3995 [Singulisphaera acidiphila DSM 18658]